MGYRDDEQLIPKSKGSWQDGDHGYNSIHNAEEGSTNNAGGKDRGAEGVATSWLASITEMISTIPAVMVLASWNIMLAIPFGTMFFSNDVPLSHEVKEKLGLRMSLLALGICQTLIGGKMTSFEALTLWAMAEVAPFYQAFAEIAANNCGDDPSRIYPTTAYLISLSTISVGLAYLMCGAFRIGKILSFFPSYVVLGVIGGVGVWAAKQSVTVSVSPHVFDGADEDGLWNYMITPHFFLSAFFGLAIRPLRAFIPPERFLLLDPTYYLSIPIIFYCVITVFGVPFDKVVEAGYLFKAPTANTTDDQPSVFAEAAELWTKFDFSKVQWDVAFQAVPQIFATSILAVMVTAPFVPPIATLLDMDDFDLDQEFIAHGLPNIISGLVVPGGIPACACYSSTVLYVNSGGKGKFANSLLAGTSFISFVYGPALGGYLPRCMASAMLIDMGISLFLEGVADPNSKCDPLEYTSIWVILTVTTVFDQTSGLIAALFMALFTSTFSSSNENPVRRMCDAVTFPSSRQRNDLELAVLDNPITGRKKIVIIQLQGSVFFGNIAKVQDQVFEYLGKREIHDSIVIFDCTLVSSLDSSACIFFDKIQAILKKDHGVATIVFVASPPKLELEKAPERRSSLVFRSQNPRRHRANSILSHVDEINPAVAFGERNKESHRSHKRRSSALTVRGSFDNDNEKKHLTQICGTCFDYLDKALAMCEDKLLSMANIPISKMTIPKPFTFIGEDEEVDDPDRAMAINLLKEYCNVEDTGLIKIIVDGMKRETLPKGKIIWNLGDRGDSAKLFVQGAVYAFVEDEDEDDDFRFQSKMTLGSFLGLRSLILDECHLATARCDDECTFYSLDRAAYKRLFQESPEAASLLEVSLARYLSHKLRHVSNRIYQARSLPV